MVEGLAEGARKESMKQTTAERLKDRRAQRQTYIHRIGELETKLKAVEKEISDLTQQAKSEPKEV